MFVLKLYLKCVFVETVFEMCVYVCRQSVHEMYVSHLKTLNQKNHTQIRSIEENKKGHAPISLE